MLYKRELSSDPGRALPLPLQVHSLKANEPSCFLGLKRSRSFGRYSVPFHRCYNERECTMSREIRNSVAAFL